MKKLRGAVIGFGSVGQYLTDYVNNRRPDAEIVIACNRGAAKLEIAKNKFGLATTHDPKEAIDYGVDFVLITSTNLAHKEQVLLAAKAGKPIFCEKPVALNLPDAKEMADAVDQAGVVNVVNYSLRYIPAFMQLKQMIDAGDLGRILTVWSTRSRGWGLWSGKAPKHDAVARPEESGGWSVHHMCHDLDLLYWWLGPITQVYGAMNSTVPADRPYSEESVVGIVNFASGASAMLGDTSCGLRWHYTGVIGDKGQALMDSEGGEPRLTVKSEITGEQKVMPIVAERPDGAGMGHFLDCIIKGTPSRATIRDSIPSLSAALAMQESNRTKRAVEVKV